MKTKLDKYELQYDSFIAIKRDVDAAVDWDKVVTSTTIYHRSRSYMVGKLGKILIGDQLRSRESLKSFVHATDWVDGTNRIVTVSQWTSEGWSIWPDTTPSE